jgi:cysteine synthase
VGSTGNLGLSIGVIASALGFKASVHMSADAKAWKKDRLRQRGVEVVEHAGDYAQAVAQGRAQAVTDPLAHFVDDERSLSLFLGYAAAVFGLRRQLAEQGIVVDAQHPLFVYLPCGVGGAPAGIAFGIRQILGPHAHCFCRAGAVALRAGADDGWLRRPARPAPTVYDYGLHNRTEADGLAVPQASRLASAAMREVLGGIYTVEDGQLMRFVYQLEQAEGLRVEPRQPPAWLVRRCCWVRPKGNAICRRVGCRRIWHSPRMWSGPLAGCSFRPRSTSSSGRPGATCWPGSRRILCRILRRAPHCHFLPVSIAIAIADMSIFTVPPAASIGAPISDIDTPALLLDLDAFERNLDDLQARADASGMALRPHGKAHKCPAVALAQIARGAVGICCQKVSEAIPFIEAGVRDIHISNEIASPARHACWRSWPAMHA